MEDNVLWFDLDIFVVTGNSFESAGIAIVITQEIIVDFHGCLCINHCEYDEIDTRLYAFLLIPSA
jgi:hypothetical protein